MEDLLRKELQEEQEGELFPEQFKISDARKKVIHQKTILTNSHYHNNLWKKITYIQYRSKLWDHLHAVKPRLCRT